MKARSTRQAARSGEFYMSKLIDWHPMEAWVELGQPTLYANARAKVQEILAAPLEDPLPEDVMGKLDEILRAAEREIKEVSQ